MPLSSAKWRSASSSSSSLACSYARSTGPLRSIRASIAHGVELMSIDLAQAGYTDTTGRPFVRELVDRVRLLPGVQTATIASAVPGGFEVRREALSVSGGSSLEQTKPLSPWIGTWSSPVTSRHFGLRSWRGETSRPTTATEPRRSRLSASRPRGSSGRDKVPSASTCYNRPGARKGRPHPMRTAARGGRGARHPVQQPDRWPGARLGVCPLSAAIPVEYDHRCAHDPWAAYGRPSSGCCWHR